MRRQSHAMLDDMFDHMENLREAPLWRDPTAARPAGPSVFPLQPTSLAEVHQTFLEEVLPFGSGNAHPGFMGWVQGGGTAVGMMAEMLAAG